MTTKIKHFIRNFKHYSAHDQVLLVGVITVSVCFIVYLFITFHPFSSQAATAQLSFSPSSGNIPPNTNVGIVVNAGASRIAFARVEVTFDKTKVNLASDPNVSGPLKAVIGVTNRTDSNAAGKVTAVLAICNSITIPCSPSPTAPTGSFTLLGLTFQSVTSAATTATISYNVGGSQLVDTAQANLGLTGTSATFQINTTGGTTQTPTRTPTPIRTGTVTPTKTPTPIRTITLTPTKTPTPRNATNTPTRVPTLTQGITATPTNSAAIPGDINADGLVDIVDYTLLFTNIGKLTSDPGVDSRCDLIQDGAINILDYTVLYENFGRTI